MDDPKMVNASVEVTFGKAWYKLIGVSVLMGTAVALGVYSTGRMVFKDTFTQTKVIPLGKGGEPL